MRSLLGAAMVAVGLSAGVSALDEPRYRRSTRKIEHTETPKPLTKRQKRRLRGKSKK